MHFFSHFSFLPSIQATVISLWTSTVSYFCSYSTPTRLHKENQIKYLLFLKFLNCFLLQLKKSLTLNHVAAKHECDLTLPSPSCIFCYPLFDITTFKRSNLLLKTPVSKSPVSLLLLSRWFCFLLVLVIGCFLLWNIAFKDGHQQCLPSFTSVPLCPSRNGAISPPLE